MEWSVRVPAYCARPNPEARIEICTRDSRAAPTTLNRQPRTVNAARRNGHRVRPGPHARESNSARRAPLAITGYRLQLCADCSVRVPVPLALALSVHTATRSRYRTGSEISAITVVAEVCNCIHTFT